MSEHTTAPAGTAETAAPAPKPKRPKPKSMIMLGEQTAQLLFRRIENKVGNQQIMLSTTLVKRASTERKAR